VAADWNDENVLYAAVYGGGIFKSWVGGGSWSAINSGLGEKFIHALVMDPGNPLILYAGGDSTGVYKSSDGGASWTANNGGLPTVAQDQAYLPPFNHLPDPERDAEFAMDFYAPNASIEAAIPVLAIAIDPLVTSTLYIGTRGLGVRKSIDGSGNWTTTSLSSQTVYALAVDPTNSNILYAGLDGTQGSFYRSVNGGLGFTKLDTGISGLTVYAILLDSADPKKVSIGTSAGVFTSPDSGATWQGAGLAADTVYALAATSFYPGKLFAGTKDNGIQFTSDNGATWAAWTSGILSREVQALQFTRANPARLLVGTRASGMYRSD
jgi:hypothetical protein